MLANRIKCSHSAISQWERVPAERVLAVAEACGWRVTPNQLRPDLYPNQMDGLPICRLLAHCED